MLTTEKSRWGDVANTAYVHFLNSNDANTNNDTFDCKILSQGGVSGVSGKGDLVVYSNKTNFYSDVDVFQKQCFVKHFN